MKSNDALILLDKLPQPYNVGRSLFVEYDVDQIGPAGVRTLLADMTDTRFISDALRDALDAMLAYVADPESAELADDVCGWLKSYDAEIRTCIRANRAQRMAESLTYKMRWGVKP